MTLAFGALDADPETASKVGQEICRTLKAAGLDVAWDGTVNTRIHLPKFKWKNRSNGKQGLLRIFYADYGRGRFIDANEPQGVSISASIREMETVLGSPGNFFGLIDPHDVTLQFAVNDDLMISVDLPIVADQGSYITICSLQECVELVQGIDGHINREKINGLKFQSW